MTRFTVYVKCYLGMRDARRSYATKVVYLSAFTAAEAKTMAVQQTSGEVVQCFADPV